LVALLPTLSTIKAFVSKFQFGFRLCAFLPKLTDDHYRVYVAHCYNEDITPDIFLESFRFGILKFEYIKAHDYCNGIIGILDYRKMNIMKLIAALELVTLQQFLCILMEGYGIRIAGVHIVSPSKAVEALVKIIKPLFGPKVSQRIHVHATIEALYDYAPKKYITSELGGNEESIAVLKEQWKDLLGTKENVNYMQEMSNAVSNEAYKIKDKYNLDGAGTFRSLSVD
ncbi:alpha-tocopherol transfer protein-like, partial [Manduca sexta]|uniref:alpha-tocopherol transfer protein-like n=1 Tax=Manduca sexta TaxID=7130 RepID=UPI0018907CDE